MSAIAHLVAQTLKVPLLVKKKVAVSDRKVHYSLPIEIRREISRLLAEGKLDGVQIAARVGGGATRFHVADIRKRARLGRGHIDT